MAEKKTKTLETSDKAYSFFIVINNPRKHDIAGLKVEDMEHMTNEEICQALAEDFCQGDDARQAAFLYCLSASGHDHIHAIVSSDVQMRFSAIKKYLGNAAHIEATRGNKKQADDYINKRGKFEEKGEKILAKYQIGEIKGRQGKRTDLEVIRQAVNAGMSWQEIRRLNDRFYSSSYTAIIKNMSFDKRSQETPFKRDVNVHWYVGASGSGKTGVTLDLIKQYGEDNVYLVSDYQNPFDGYAGEKIIVLDEFRGQLPYASLLGMLEGYKKEIHCRYANVVGLWTEVYITTIKTPEEVYSKMIEQGDENIDPISQLLGRIKDISYCYRVNRPDGAKTDRDGNPAEFLRFTLSGKDYRDLKSEINNTKRDQLRFAAYLNYMIHYHKEDDSVEDFTEYEPKPLRIVA